MGSQVENLSRALETAERQNQKLQRERDEVKRNIQTTDNISGHNRNQLI
jgi:cell division protein FtsB